MAQALGNGLNTLQQEQDIATQPVDLLHGGIGRRGHGKGQRGPADPKAACCSVAHPLDNQAAGLILQLFKYPDAPLVLSTAFQHEGASNGLLCLTSGTEISSASSDD